MGKKDDKAPYRAAISEVLRRALEENNWSHQELGRRAGIATSTVHSHASALSLPSADMLRRYAAVVDVPYKRLMILAGYNSEQTGRPAALEAMHDLLDEGWAHLSPDAQELVREALLRGRRKGLDSESVGQRKG